MGDDRRRSPAGPAPFGLTARQRAANAAQPTAVEAAIRELLESLKRGDEQRAEAAAGALAAYSQLALPYLEQMLASPEPEQRWWAVRALAESDAPGTAPLLRSALQDANDEVRQCAAVALRQRPDPEATPGLLELLSADDPLLARLAGDALIAAGEWTVTPLVEVMQNGSGAARREAARALAYIADPRAVGALYAAQDEDSAWMAYWAGEGLQRMGVGMVFFKP